MNTQRFEQLWAEFEDHEYRHAYADSLVDSTIATQLKLLREQNTLTQAQLAALADMQQSRISAMEDVNYSSWSVTTLKRLAKAFDCGLDVRFVPFSRVVHWGASMTTDALRVPRFDEDAKANKSRKAAAKVTAQEQLRQFQAISGAGKHTQRDLSFMRNFAVVGGNEPGPQISRSIATTGERTIVSHFSDTQSASEKYSSSQRRAR